MVLKRRDQAEKFGLLVGPREERRVDLDEDPGWIKERRRIVAE